MAARPILRARAIRRRPQLAPRGLAALALVCLLPVSPSAHAQSTLAEQIAAVRREHDRRVAAETAERRVPGSTVALLQGLFHTRVTVTFDDTPVADALGDLRAASGVPIVGRFLDDRVGVGIDPATRITLEATELRLVDALELVLEQCVDIDGCTWQLRKGVVEVGTRERLSLPASRELRCYPVAQLLFEAPRFEHSIPRGFGYGASGYRGMAHHAAAAPGSAYRPGWSRPRGAAGAIGHGPARPRSGDPDTRNGPRATAARAEELIEFITAVVEPALWVRNGGDGATIVYRDGALFVHAPEFVHRRIAGYPPVPPPAAAEPEEAGAPGSENTRTKQAPNAGASPIRTP